MQMAPAECSTQEASAGSHGGQLGATHKQSKFMVLSGESCHIDPLLVPLPG